MIKSSFPTFEQLRAFLVTLQEGSFSGAAETLETTQATISRQISSLEKSLGQALLYRTTRAIQLTESGQLFERHARELLQEWQIAKLSVRSSVESVRGEIKMAAPQLFSELYLAPCLPEFLANNNKLTLSVTIAEQQDSLVENGFDFAVRAGSLADSALYYRPICQSKLVLVASPNFLETLPPINSPDDLPVEKCFDFREGGPWTFQKGSEVKNLQPVAGLHTESPSFMLAGIRNGLGFAIAPQWVVAKYVAARELVTVLNDYKIDSELAPYCELNFVYPVKTTTKKIQLLMDYVILQFEKARINSV